MHIILFYSYNSVFVVAIVVTVAILNSLKVSSSKIEK